MLCGLPDVFDDPPDRRTDDDQLGIGHALVQIDGRAIDGPDLTGNPQADLPTADADDVFCQLACRKASPIDPPINPTPTMATVSHCFMACFVLGRLLSLIVLKNALL